MKRWMRDNGLDWRDVVLAVLYVVAFAGFVAFSIYATRICAATHGGHWWCWL